MADTWMIYGANGYTGTLIAQAAVMRGLKPILGGRSTSLQSLAESLGLESRIFDLGDPAVTAQNLSGLKLVLHCAGPFSATARPMMAACLQTGTHYLDITGEISVFEHARTLNEAARTAGIVICPGVGFDVIPTDCIAASLKAALPNATHLTLGFDSRSPYSPGTAKTSIESMAEGGKLRADGRIVSVPLAYETRRIDFGAGEKLAMTIPWGDISTAYTTTGIPNIAVFVPASPKTLARARRANYLRWFFRLKPVQFGLKRLVAKSVTGPSAEKRDITPTYVWGEVSNAAGELRTARIKTANGYSVTVSGSLAVVEHLLTHDATAGATTPALLMGADLVTKLPGSGPITITRPHAP